jgi:hypothetical protein
LESVAKSRFPHDPARYAWIISEYKKRCPSSPKLAAKAVRQLGLEAFDLTLAELTAHMPRSREFTDRRQKITALIYWITGASLAMIGELIERSDDAIINSAHKYHNEIACFLGGNARG